MMKRLIAAMVWGGTLLFFAFSLSFTLFRYYTSDLQKYQTIILAKLTQLTQTPITFAYIDTSWHGFSPAVVLHQAHFVINAGPEFTISADKVAVELDLFASLIKRSPVFNYAAARNVSIEIRHKNPPTKNPREVLHAALNFLPQLRLASLDDVHLKIFLTNTDTPDVEFKTLSAYFHARTFKGNQLDFVEHKNNQISKMTWQWKRAEEAKIYLDLQDYPLPIALSALGINPSLTGELWGKWQHKDLAYLRGTVTVAEPHLLKPLPLTMAFNNTQGYQLDLATSFGRLGGRIFAERFGLQLIDFELTQLTSYYGALPPIIDALAISQAWGSGTLAEGIDSLDIAVADLGIKISTDNALPHIDQLGLTIKGRRESGVIEFTKGLRLRQGFFKTDLANIMVKQAFSYQYADGRLTLFPNLLIAHDAVDANIQGQFSIAYKPGYEVAIYSGLYGKIKPLPLKEVLRYLPNVYIPESVNAWLDAAIDPHSKTKGLSDWRLIGNLRKSPWAENSDAKVSQFRAEFDTDKASLDIMPKELVALKNIDAHVVVENNYLGVVGHNSTLLKDIKLTDIRVDIPHFHRAHLDIEGAISAPFAQVQAYFAQSPFLKSIHQVTDEFSGESALKGRLALIVPLATEQTPALSIKGHADLTNAHIIYKALGIDLKKGQGRIYFDQLGLKASNKLTGEVYEQATTIDITRSQTGTNLTFTGTQTPQTWLNKFVPFLAPFVVTEGRAPTESILTIPFTVPENWTLAVKADLTPVDIDAPLGLDKEKKVNSALTVNVGALKNHKKKITVALPALLSVDIEDPTEKGWAALRIKVNTAEAKGRIDSASVKKFNVNFDYLVLPYESRVSKGTVTAIPEASNIFTQLSYKELPELDLVVTNLYRGNDALGKLNASSRFLGDYWRIKPFKLESAAHRVNAEIEWRPLDTVAKTQVKADFETFTKEAMNGLLGMDVGLTGLMRGELSLLARETLDKIDFTTVDASGKLFVNKGNVRSVSIGPLKALGAMNISTLARRLKFDFSDLKEKGLSFDAAEGMVALNNNQLYLNDIIVDAPSLNAKLKGVVDLTKKEYDINVKAFPKASFLAPVAGTILGGPIIGAGVLVFERIFDDEINKLPRTDIQWKGSFE